MTIIQNEYARGAIVFDADYRTGSIADKSPYKAAATVTAPVQWCNTKRGYAVRMTGAGLISYADNVANRLAGSNATWAFLGNFASLSTAAIRLVSKRTAGGTSYDISTFVSGGDKRIYLWEGSASRYGVVPTWNYSLLVMTLESGQAAKVYGDGTYVMTLNGVSTIPNRTDPLLVGGYYDAGSQTPCIAPLGRVLILNRALSPAEISQLYQELMAERYPLRAYSFGCRISAPKDPPGVAALLKTDFTTRLADGRLADLSGNGWHGTIKPGFVAGPGMCGQALLANSASRTYVDFGEVPINGVSKLTVVHYGQRGASSPSEILIDKGTAANNRNEINQSTTQITWNVGSGGVIYAASVNDANVNTPLFQAWSYNGDAPVNGDKVKVNLDGAKPTVTITANFPTTLPSTIGTPLTFGRLGWLANFPPPKQSDFFAAYLGALTHEQTEYIRKQIAARCTFELDMQRVPVSLANLVGPCEVPNTPFRLQSGGTWKVSEDAAGKRWFESVAGAFTPMYMRSTQAYGTWVFDVTTSSSSRDLYAFIMDKIDFHLDPKAGYSLEFGYFSRRISLLRRQTGANEVLFTSDFLYDYSTRYQVAITRTSQGVFTVYIRGGAFRDWSVITVGSGTNPVTDNTYKTSSYFDMSVQNGTTGAKLGNVRMFAGPFTLDMLREHCP